MKIACMIKSIAVIASLLFSLHAATQEAFFPKGTSWTVSYYGYLQDTGIDRISTVEEDTVINNLCYRVVRTHYPSCAIRDHNVAECAIREENSRVFAYYFDRQEEYLYYDFDWSDKKDIALVTFRTDCPVYAEVGETDDVRLNDGSMSEKTTDNMWHITILKGIGKVNVYGGLFVNDFLEPDNGCSYFISSFVRNGVELYTDVVTSISPVKCTEVQEEYFDLQGRRLNGVPQRGMYIRDGRKYVVK